MNFHLITIKAKNPPEILHLPLQHSGFPNLAQVLRLLFG